jgi:hypothetical protein
VVIAKRNFKHWRIYSNKVDKSTGLKYDQTIKLTGNKTKILYLDKLRKIKYYNKEKDKTIYEILQILSVSAFDKTSINQLLTESDLHKNENPNCNQLKMVDL